MRHVTHQHAGSSVDEATCSLFAAIERVTHVVVSEEVELGSAIALVRPVRLAFSGLHYAALTAPGPTGTRPEHITDLPNVLAQDSC